jgi:hypothetical protein
MKISAGNILLMTLLLVTAVTASGGSDIPQQAPHQHLGVASCAASVCHGSVTSRTGTAVQQNEYVIWSLRDRHRIAYRTLLSADSKAIAAKLGITSAHESDLCLDCHADNVPVSLRGDRFQLDDGIGCEACHGGAELYIASHTDPATARDDLLEAGLYPTDDVRHRAQLCLSCHLGSAQKMATHKIMGAGHPRLSFELETFSVLQPPHYVVDDDYRQAKWAGSSIELWATGQLESARQCLDLIETSLSAGGLFPELALFDCHACHHPMSQQRWQASDRAQLPPGSVRLNDASFTMLLVMARVVQPELERELQAGLRQLHQAASHGKSLRAAVAGLMQVVATLAAQLEQAVWAEITPALIAAIVETATEGRLNDYVAAEQALMAVDMLLSASEQRDKQGDWLDAVYMSLADEDNFNAVEFVQQMRHYDKGMAE